MDEADYQYIVNLSKQWVKKTEGLPEAFNQAFTETTVKPTLHQLQQLQQLEHHSHQEVVCIKFKKTHPDAKLPTKAYSDLDNCWDLYCCEQTTIPGSRCNNENEFVVGSNIVPVGLQVAYVTPGFGFATKQKSGLAFKLFIMPVAGEMDSNYRGDFSVKLINLSPTPYVFEVGDKITQFKVEKIWKTDISFTDDVEVTECGRGDGGFGSSGKQ